MTKPLLKQNIVPNNWQDKTMESLKRKDIKNPILQRLRSNFSGKTGLVITSYDRMYHRHNRG